jgi:universal stress protein A
MKTFSHILCPYDFSDYADEALLYAMMLAEEDTKLLLVHVAEIPFIQEPTGFVYFENKADELLQASTIAMEKVISNLKQLDPKININYIILSNNDPGGSILKIQHEQRMDLVVMGSHGRKGLHRLLMGSVAETVLRDATCPVLIVKV